VEGSVNVNAGAYGGDAPEPEDSSFDQPAAGTEVHTADLSGRLGWVDAPQPPQLRPPKASTDIGAASGDRGFAGAPARSDLGPCLYFGSAGQRCDRRATANGYCSRHQPASLLGAPSLSIPQISKRALGAAGILAALWPILADLIRELLRLFR
jgi:hypothetical protein